MLVSYRIYCSEYLKTTYKSPSHLDLHIYLQNHRQFPQFFLISYISSFYYCLPFTACANSNSTVL